MTIKELKKVVDAMAKKAPNGKVMVRTSKELKPMTKERLDGIIKLDESGVTSVDSVLIVDVR